MEFVIVAWIGSAIISVLMGNIIGIRYLKANDEKWNNTFKEMCDYINDVISSHKQ